MQTIIIIVMFIDYHAVQPWNRHNPLGLWQHECAEIELGGGQVFNDETTQRGKYPRIGLSYFSSLGVYKPVKNDTYRSVLQFQNTKLFVPGGSKWSHRNGGQIIQVDQCRAC